MKRVFILLAVSLSLAGRCAAAQDAPPAAPASTNASTPSPAAGAAALAAKEAADERYKRMAADIEALQLDNESLKGKIASLEQKINDLRQQLAAAANNSGVQEDLKRLAENIAQVDKKREEDKQAISEEIRKSIVTIEKNLAGAAAPIHAPAPKLQLEPQTPVVENGFSYTIKEGDSLSAIVHAYNTDFKSKGLKTITLKQAMEANPNVKWDHLLVGQKIVIPKPEGQ
jgi:predicted RNase H-like nuclease (RuvC/YqgF family)